MRRVGLALAAIFCALGCNTEAHAQTSPLYWPSQSIADMLQYAAPASGATVAVLPGYSAVIINNTVLLASLTVTLPPNPVDGQRVVIVSGAGITLLTIDGNGKTVKGLITGLSVNGYARYIYSTSADAWFRSG